MFVRQKNAVQCGRLQSRPATETPDQGARPRVEIDIRLADREPNATGGPELLHHYESRTCRAKEFKKRHILDIKAKVEAEIEETLLFHFKS